VTVSLHLLNDDGNSFDAFFLAAILALKNTRLPEVSMTRDKLKINDGKLKYVNVHHIPISTTFYFMKDIPDTPIIDVNSKEERLCTSRLSIVMNAYEDICGMCTLGALNLASNKEDEEEGSEDEGMAVTNPLHSAALF
jgi:exosome complex component RRP45